MPDCDYCDADFDDEEAYLKHLRDEHEGELGRIERRRVENLDDGSGLSATTLAGIGIALAVVGLIGAVFLLDSGGGGSPGEPYAYGSIHGHGDINVTIDGRTIDFTRPKYQVSQTGNDAFHFERGTDIWHVHAKGVTLKYAMGTLGIKIDGDCVTFNGSTYCDSNPGTSVTIQVNGKSVNASERVLKGTSVEKARRGQGPSIKIVVRTNRSATVAAV